MFDSCSEKNPDYESCKVLVENETKLDNKTEVVDIPDEPEGAWISFKTLWAYLGPGFLMCIAYLDPGNLEADLQTGSYTGFQLLWLLLLAHLIGLLLQCMTTRLSSVSGEHLASICRLKYPKPIGILLWLMAELAIIGSDIQEVLGSAIALELLTGVPLWVGCVITAIDTLTFLFMSVFGVRKLEALFVFLISIMTASFFFNFTYDPPTSRDVVDGFIPYVNRHNSVTALGLLGAIIMPHNLFLHSAIVLNRKFDRTNFKKIKESIKYTSLDSAIALTIAFLVNLTVVGTFAQQFYSIDCSDTEFPTACLQLEAINQEAISYGTCANGNGLCQEIKLGYAGYALKGSIGEVGKYVWAVGLLAAGQSSTMTGTYTSQFVMEGFLNLKMSKWKRAVITRVIALGPALLATIATRGNEFATDSLTQGINVLMSVQLPFALIPLIHFNSSESVMGQFRVGTKLKILLWFLTFSIIGINLYTVTNSFAPFEDSIFFIPMCIIGLLYLSLCAYLMSEDCQSFIRFLTKYEFLETTKFNLKIFLVSI